MYMYILHIYIKFYFAIYIKKENSILLSNNKDRIKHAIKNNIFSIQVDCFLHSHTTVVKILH